MFQREQPQQQNQNPTPLQKGVQEIFQTAFMLPAITVMVCLRGNIGYRLLKPIGLLMLLLLFNHFFVRAPLTPFLIFWYAAFVLGVYQRAKRWIEGHRGRPQHSYYLGDSIFNRLPVPRWVRRHRLLDRFFDPVFCFGLGMWILIHAENSAGGLAAWLMLAGVILMGVEFQTYRFQFVRDMDMVDGMVYGEYQGEKVDNFTPEPESARSRQTSGGISTGMDEDLQAKVRERKRGR